MAEERKAGDERKAGEERKGVEDGFRRLAAWASAVALDDLPDDVRRRAALVVADDLAAAVGAREHREVRDIQRRLAGETSAREATIFCGRGWKADRYSAALANAVAGSWTELDEGYSVASCHAGLYVFPPVLAEAEAAAVATGEVLRAVAVGYEVAARIARTWTFPRFTVHPHSAYAAVGAAAALAALRGYAERPFADALSAAATFVGAGSYRHALEGGTVRNLWAAHGVWCGMRLADWAVLGIAGLGRSLYDVFTEALSVAPKTAELTTRLGSSWAIFDGFQKVHACCQSAHTAVDATLAALARLPPAGGSRAVERIVVETPRLEMDNRAPANTLAAKFSLPHVVAASVVYGHAGAEAFSDQSLAHPEVARLRSRVELRPLAMDQARTTRARPARVSLVLADGRTLAEERIEPFGNPRNPLPEGLLWDKIAALTAPAYPRMGAVLLEVVGLAEGRLRAPWGAAVADMARGERA
ncbi:MAG: MmgE/PrpD family protein [Proteobacteria bacterium]|nr:MmgE/PrpD family protein [Pseudomonadota bacterium]